MVESNSPFSPGPTPVETPGVNGQPTPINVKVGQPPIGEDLRHVRLGLRWSVEFVAAQLQISSRHLGQIESGIRTPDRELLADLGNLYGIDLSQLEQRIWAERDPGAADSGPDASTLTWVPSPTEHDGNEALLRSIGATLRSMRSIGMESPVYLRAPDFPVLAPRIDLDDPKLSLHLMQHLRLTWTESCELIDALRQVGDSGGSEPLVPPGPGGSGEEVSSSPVGRPSTVVLHPG